MVSLKKILVVLTVMVCAPMSATARIWKITGRETSSCQERGSSGFICDSCQLLATCVKVAGRWITVPVETCNSDMGMYCNLNEGRCSNRTGPCHPNGYEGNFACTSEGVFPDPYDCQKYHFCYKAGTTVVSANVDCGTNKAFSPATGDCSHTIYDNVCIGLQYKCSRAGDMQVWPGNDNIFYICKSSSEQDVSFLYPTLYRCGSGESFNGINCMPKDTDKNSTTDAENTTTFKSHFCTGFALNPDPADCRSYYKCRPNGLAEHYTCPRYSHFDKKTSSCTFGDC